MTVQKPSAHRRSVRAALVEELRAAIGGGALAPGMPLPSVRRLARERGVSAFTAAEVYNVLTAAGLVEARRGSGYFVAGTPPPAPARTADAAVDALWERRVEARARPILVDAGGGWLPAAWQFGDGVRAGLRALARLPLPTDGYGSPLGLEPLRAHFAMQLRGRGLALGAEQLVLTQGASQALDLAVRALLEPGDRVAVDEPGYPPVLELLRARGARLIGIPRTAEGPDPEALAAAARRRGLKALITNTTLQNPTGTTTSVPVARRLLEVAERHGLLVVEDDIFADLAPTPVTSLATLDQCRRVVYVSSVSKSISPTLRVGYLAAPAELAPRLARLKALSALA